jgi:sortase A
MRRIIGGVGRALVTIGILILLFVAYQLWGTGFYEAREQSRLKSEFVQDLARVKALEAKARAETPTTTTTLPPPPPPVGDPVGVIHIPKIGLDRVVIQGIGVPDLRKGPGHYPATPLPGQLGNAAIAGHRTTYGAPFNRLDELAVVDPILVQTISGTFHYSVTQQLVVSPKEVSVLNPTAEATLTLTTCNPKFSASQRLVVKAILDPERSPEPVKAPPEPVASRASLDDALSGRGEPKLPTVWFGLLTALFGAVWWLVFHRYHRWTTWFMGAIPFAIALVVFYYHLERLLPANY